MSKRPASDDEAEVGPPRPPADDVDVGPPRPAADDADDADVGPPRPPADEADVGPPRPAADDVGPPRPNDSAAAPAHKKRKAALEFEQLYLDNLPVSEMYEKSYMHRDVVTDLLVTPNEFIITASCDGQVKFWKKGPGTCEFVKHFRSHVGAVTGMAASADGSFLATVCAQDQSLKMYDIVNFDMISMVKLPYKPGACAWVSRKGAADGIVAVSDKESTAIRLYRARSGSSDPISENSSVHSAPVRLMAYNPVYHTVVSADDRGMVEYWSPDDFELPEGAVKFSFKAETSLYEFCKKKTKPQSLAFSADGSQFVCMGEDKNVRVFKFQTGKLRMQYDEGAAIAQEIQQNGDPRYHLDPMEFGRRMAVEHSLDQPSNAVFDESGHFLIYSTMLGIKIVNTHTHQVTRLLGKVETNERFVRVALYQGKPKPPVGQSTTLAAAESDPTIFCTSNKKSRFFYFSNRDPPEEGRDVFNERPTKDDVAMVLDADASAAKAIKGCIIRTTMGDIHCKLYSEEVPKTVENFTTHAKNGYYDNCIFHRIIKSFMLQTGDPLGDGTGGQSIWGGEFEDEFHRDLRHDRPYTLSMANAGPNTNGSQFFITTVATPWLDNKHSVFGRVTKGGDVCAEIENCKTDHRDKPYTDIKIINIDIVQ